MTDTKKSPIHNAIRLLGETRLPGASLLLDGEIGPGALRLALGVTARVLIGPVGWFAVAADSYTKSTTGRGLIDHASEWIKPGSKAAAKPVEAPSDAAAAAPV